MNDKKGGILAMGDHAELGRALSGSIPRVRNMRKWSTADGVPSNVGPNRHDTLVKGHDFATTTGIDESNQYTFDDESDDVPMKIRNRWYYSHLWTPFHPKHWYWDYKWRKHPHPILCGNRGIINVLPDHPHEGECVVPSNLTLKPKFNSYEFDEYPIYNGTTRISPEVIAWARIQNDHKLSDFKQEVNPKEFGAIGAYNGHTVDVGRVVVDSTWHHWFDVNLTGRMLFNSDVPVPGPSGLVNTGDPRKLNGFNDTPAGIIALNKIRNYFRNVAIWLSPPAKIKSMNNVLLWNSIFRYPLFADLDVTMPAWVIGHHAIDVLGNYAGQCNIRTIWIYYFKKLRLDTVFNEKLLPSNILAELDEFMIGGILKSLLQFKAEIAIDKLKPPAEKELLRFIEQGFKIAFEEMQEFLKNQEEADRRALEVFKELQNSLEVDPPLIKGESVH
jgi:hypothetical protein